MKWFRDVNNRQIRLTHERQEHLEAEHPEMSREIEKIRDTLLNPDRIVRSLTDPEVELFYRHYDTYNNHQRLDPSKIFSAAAKDSFSTSASLFSINLHEPIYYSDLSISPS